MPTIKASDANAIIGSFIPPSVVMPCAASTAPSGWLICDGTDYAQADYKALYDLITSTYDTQINPTTGIAYDSPGTGRFRVPDYRGLFLRSDGQHVNQDTSKSVGDYTSDQMQGHYHDYRFDGTGNNHGVQGSGSLYGLAYVGGASTGGTSYVESAITDNTNGSIRKGKETRPANKAVKYIIKY